MVESRCDFFLLRRGIFIPHVRKDVVGNGIPGIVNPGEEQEQHRTCDN
jgi:hypothetical protein